MAEITASDAAALFRPVSRLVSAASRNSRALARCNRASSRAVNWRAGPGGQAAGADQVDGVLSQFVYESIMALDGSLKFRFGGAKWLARIGPAVDLIGKIVQLLPRCLVVGQLVRAHHEDVEVTVAVRFSPGG